ncbi:MAG TPA: glycosyltransferase family 1 protein [Vicinamibacteria bacterium]|nr:glycosyltransferase family 1 protein [Vicinamibacteria bacterium]
MGSTLTQSGLQGRQARALPDTRRTSLPPKMPDLVCLSHLRWNTVYQRPHHLMSRFARRQRVYFVEEPVFESGITAHLGLSITAEAVFVVVPHLPQAQSPDAGRDALERLLSMLLRDSAGYVFWYCTPMALDYTRHLDPVAVVYDCMDELSAFRGAPRALPGLEAELMQAADVVFAGGRSLFESRRTRHSNIHAFPSSVDVGHFRTARKVLGEPADQAGIAHPRLGFLGVIDERTDLALLDGVAAARPQWQLVLLGPTAKIDPADLPRRPNIHYLGQKAYRELPRYLARWDVALLPFARNESTRFVSPTTTPEYLAAGCPVVSTAIHDVVRPYGEQGLVRIADTVEDFVSQVEGALAHDRRSPRWRRAVDSMLATTSWDRTWGEMATLVDEALQLALRPRHDAAWVRRLLPGEA